MRNELIKALFSGEVKVVFTHGNTGKQITKVCTLNKDSTPGISISNQDPSSDTILMYCSSNPGWMGLRYTDIISWCPVC